MNGVETKTLARNTFVLVVLLAIAQLVAPQSGELALVRDPSTVWQPLNDGLPGYAFVTSIAAVPVAGSKDALLAAVYDPTGVYRSQDGGKTWEPSNTGLQGAGVFTLTPASGDARTLFAGTVAGLYRSRDGGNTWSLETAANQPVYAILVDPGDSSTLYAGTTGAVLSSRDGGGSWSSDSDGLQGIAVLSVVRSGSALLAGTNGAGIMRRDAAGGWQSVASRDSIVSTVVADPFDDDTMLARARRSLLRSRDAGQSWQVLPEIEGTLLGLAFDPQQLGVVYAQTAQRGVLVSRDYGETWSSLGQGLEGRPVYALGFSRAGAHALLAGTQHAIWELSYGTWQALGRPPGAPIVRALTMSAAGDLLAGTTDGVFRHENSGWNRLGSGLTDVQVLSLATDDHDPARILAGTFGSGVQVSIDGGTTWMQATNRQFTNIIVPALAVDPSDPQRIYGRVEYARLTISNDNGQTWQESTLPVTVTVFAVAIAPDSSRLYAGTDHGVYRSDDRGEHWRALPGPPGMAGVLALVVDRIDADHVLAGGSAGVYRSQDGGLSWQAGAGLDNETVTAVTFVPSSPGVLYAGTRYHGAFVSRDSGATWQALGIGLRQMSVNSLAIDPVSGALYAGTETGVYVLANPEMTATDGAGVDVTALADFSRLQQAVVDVRGLGQSGRPSQDLNQVSLGMHTLRADGRMAGLIRDAGFDSIVQLIAWREVEPDRGRYVWEFPDAVLRAAEFYGLAPILRVDFQPGWARATAMNAPPRNLDDYGDFLSRLAQRYRGRVKAYVIWNEPNLSSEWGGDRPDPAAYARMLDLAYRRVKEADPQALVVAAGLAPTNEHSDNAVDDRDFLREMYAAGAAGSFDALAAHPYGFGLPPDDAHGAHDGLNMARLLDLREIMAENDDREKPVWITEMGWTTGPGNQPAVSPDLQAAYLAAAFERVIDDWPWVRFIAAWNLSEGLQPDDEMRGYSLVGDAGGLTPAYGALRGLAQRLRRPVSPPATPSAAPVQILAPDVEVHLGDQDGMGFPWVPLYGHYMPSREWSGEFFVPDPGSSDWTLQMDGLQFNEWGNLITINGRPPDPRFLPGRINDWAGYWTRLQLSVPAAILRPGLNHLTIRVAMNAPVHQATGVSWEDLQFRNVTLIPQP